MKNNWTGKSWQYDDVMALSSFRNLLQSNGALHMKECQNPDKRRYNENVLSELVAIYKWIWKSVFV